MYKVSTQKPDVKYYTLTIHVVWYANISMVTPYHDMYSHTDAEPDKIRFYGNNYCYQLPEPFNVEVTSETQWPSIVFATYEHFGRMPLRLYCKGKLVTDFQTSVMSDYFSQNPFSFPPKDINLTAAVEFKPFEVESEMKKDI